MMNYNNFRPSGFSYLPEIVKHIIILNVLFFIVQLVVEGYTGNSITWSLGLHYPGSEAFKPYQFLTYMFLHGSLMHIFFNLFAIWMFGSVIEQVMGPSRFLLYYLITGIGAALLHNLVIFFEINPTIQAVNGLLADPSFDAFSAFIHSSLFKYEHLNVAQVDASVDYINRLQLVDPESARQLMLTFLTEYRMETLNAPVVIGASGSLFGILLAFGMLFPNNLIYLYFAIPVKAKYFVIIYGAIELFLGVSNAPGDNVAHFAHLGGMVFGFIMIKYWKLKQYRNPYD